MQRPTFYRFISVSKPGVCCIQSQLNPEAQMRSLKIVLLCILALFSRWLHSGARCPHVVAQMASHSCRCARSQFRNSSKKSVSFPTVSAAVPDLGLIGLDWIACSSPGQSQGTGGSCDVGQPVLKAGRGEVSPTQPGECTVEKR